MDSLRLKELKELANDLSILYVEDSIVLQKLVGRFLSKIFNNFHQAYNGEEGYRKFKEHKPDLLLTDLTMPYKNGIDMIIDIKDKFPDVKVIVLSAHNDDLTLLRTIDLGIFEFLLKPVDLEKLTDTFIRAIKDEGNLDEKNRCYRDLKIIFEQNTHVQLINSYKGIPVVSEGYLVDFKENSFSVSLSELKMAALENESNIVLKLKEINRHIRTDIVKLEVNKNQVVLANPEYINFSLSEFNYKRIAVDENFKVGLHYHNKTVNVTPVDISFISIRVFIDNRNIQLKLNDPLDINLGFEVAVNKPPYHLVKEFKKAFAKGKILKIESYKKGYYLIASLHVSKADESNFLKYIHSRKEELKIELNKFANSNQKCNFLNNSEK